MNRKQKIFLISVILLIVISVAALIGEVFHLIYLSYTDKSNTDDIFGSATYGIVAIMLVFYLFPYFASFAVLLYSGLYSFKSATFEKAKHLHLISFRITLIIILSYGLLFVLIICPILPEIVQRGANFILFYPPLFLIASLALLASIVLDIIGTILHKREQKRQLKSIDSQKTA